MDFQCLCRGKKQICFRSMDPKAFAAPARARLARAKTNLCFCFMNWTFNDKFNPPCFTQEEEKCRGRLCHQVSSLPPAMERNWLKPTDPSLSMQELNYHCGTAPCIKVALRICPIAFNYCPNNRVKSGFNFFACNEAIWSQLWAPVHEHMLTMPHITSVCNCHASCSDKGSQPESVDTDQSSRCQDSWRSDIKPKPPNPEFNCVSELANGQLWSKDSDSAFSPQNHWW
jgi:hypothetical protein